MRKDNVRKDTVIDYVRNLGRDAYIEGVIAGEIGLFGNDVEWLQRVDAAQREYEQARGMVGK
ncbi:MAG: hypothetical protein ABIH92_03435 [Nanoarchaeota archaeon]